MESRFEWRTVSCGGSLVNKGCRLWDFTMKTRLNLQALESREVPAVASITYTDIDSDLVKIIASVPGLSRPPLDGSDLTFTDGNPDGQLA